MPQAINLSVLVLTRQPPVKQLSVSAIKRVLQVTGQLVLAVIMEIISTKLLEPIPQPLVQELKPQQEMLQPWVKVLLLRLVMLWHLVPMQ